MTRVAAAIVLLLSIAAALPGARDARERLTVPSAPDQSQKQPAPRISREPPREPRVPFAPGETLTYDVSWSSYLTAGEATATVREKKPSGSSTAYYIVAEGRPVGLVAYLYTGYYKADTLLDTSSLAPQRGSIFVQENRREQYKVSTFNQSKHTVTYEVTGRAASPPQSGRIPASTQDFLSALYIIRTLTLKSGATAQMNVFDSGDVYRVRLTGGNIERISAGTGTISAQKIDIAASLQNGERVGQSLAVWLSADARRLPVLLNADLPVGSFRLTLRGVK